MNFRKHLDLENQHAFLGGSKYHWVNYDEVKLVDAYNKFLAIQRGVDLHDFATRAINLKIKLPKNNKTLNQYVNDAIGFKMKTEQPLYYSPNCFGTPDAISFRDNFLRIHDLKTGSSTASMKQLEIYAALFFLEYQIKLSNIYIELRIYQNDSILIHNPTSADISYIMDKIILFDKKIEQIKLGKDI